MSDNSGGKRCIEFFIITWVALIVLKIMGIIGMSWVLVISFPIWLPLLIVLLFFAIGIFIIGLFVLLFLVLTIILPIILAVVVIAIIPLAIFCAILEGD